MRAQFLMSVSMAAVLGCGGGPTQCTMDADCASGTTCKFGVCGAFTRALPAGCVPAADAGPFQIVDHSKMEMLLPGCWVGCDPPSGIAGPAPANAIGWGFNSDVTRWWFLVDDGQGNAVPYQGFEQGGVVDILWPGINTDQLQVNMIATANTTFTLQPEFSEGPPLRLISAGAEDRLYVHAEISCGDVDGGSGSGGDDMGSAAPFGGACNPNEVLPVDCPALGGRRCSFCGDSLCRQPCHIGGNDCPTSQTCTAFGLTTVLMAGDCIGYDGFCS
ncbi:MAG: hypothetical protein JWN44_2986 [Myxococcales bacterium]|nr:hypothetical protein [Myxococcales bacterium]